MEDYRIKTGWRNHPKRRKLQRRLGAEGVLAIQDLWEFCAESRTDGSLAGMDAEDIAIACGWAGEPDALVATLVEFRLLDDTKEGLRIHDWAGHNPWVATSEARRSAGRVNILRRWHKEGKHGDPVEDCPLCGEDTTGTTNTVPVDTKRNTPTPTPTPSPREGGTYGGSTVGTEPEPLPGRLGQLGGSRSERMITSRQIDNACHKDFQRRLGKWRSQYEQMEPFSPAEIRAAHQAALTYCERRGTTPNPGILLPMLRDARVKQEKSPTRRVETRMRLEKPDFASGGEMARAILQDLRADS